ncbi:uncharacterized protein LOC107615353 [Arachis ipaensis]|uniref:uncharacterized protein LOC107615353 n=1 Tax=Arachis ipaensis TaxID=130454 RepID=UPI0007AFBEA7|nr:uncharacterized protein LOC107615353 [Arachis ipaensis]
MFNIKDGESIDEVFERFSIIINNLDALGTTYSEQTLVRKILRSLTKEWEMKVTVLAESNNLSPITYDELRGKLLAYETTNTNQDSKKKGIALKLRVESKESDSSDSFSDDELVFFARRLRRLMRNKGKYKGSSSKEYKKDMNKVICHHCKEAGNLKYNCPKLKKEDKGKKEKKRVLMASWEDLENDSDEEEDSECEAQICFMAGDDQLDEVNCYDLSIDDLHVIIDDLTLNSKKLWNKYNKYKSEKVILKAENDFLKEKVKENECALDIIEENRFLKSELKKLKGKHIVDPSQELVAENERLNEMIKRLNSDLAKFAHSSSNLDKLLANQRPLFEKSGLGYVIKDDAVFDNSSTKFMASSSKTRSFINKYGMGHIPTNEEEFENSYFKETESSLRT